MGRRPRGSGRSALCESRSLLHSADNGIDTALDVVHDAADRRVVDDVLDGSDSTGNRLVDGVADSRQRLVDVGLRVVDDVPDTVQRVVDRAGRVVQYIADYAVVFALAVAEQAVDETVVVALTVAEQVADETVVAVRAETAAMSSASAGRRPACAMSAPATRAKIAATVATLAFSDTATSLEIPTCAGRYTLVT